jgi:hypothetical protein
VTDKGLPMPTNRGFPDFYIFGAPKSGTTALYEYLTGHPGIFMSAIKEPQYFCTDFPDILQVHDGEAGYRRLFNGARPDQILGEGSVWYLFSRIAAANVAALRPDARIVVMLRDPVEAAQAMHSQAQLTMREDEPSFARAWDLQDDRAAGRRLPAYCPHPESLQYRDVYRYAPQVERLWAHFPKQQVKIILFDDFKADPGGVYRQVIDFLGLPAHDLPSYPKVNEAKAYRPHPLIRFLTSPPGFLRPLVMPSKRLLNRLGVKPSKMLVRAFAERGPREALSPEDHSRIAAAFRDDVARLSILLDRDLGHWLRSPGAVN